MFEACTHDVRVEVTPAYVADHSNPEDSYYFFSYHVRITNQSTKQLQLISRHWIITDGNGHVEEVQGPGVVGQQPVLQPGEKFDYSSFCPLPTPTGSMQGSYLMVDDEGHQLEVTIPHFVLCEPRSYH